MNKSPLARLKNRTVNGHLAQNTNFSIAWQSHSNIALVKYWGKKEGQLPATPSLSMTLDRAFTQTRVDVKTDQPVKGLVALNGESDHPFLPKMRAFLHWMGSEFPLLNHLTLTATTTNSFPHSTGIASSASGISAFTLCLLSIVTEIVHADPSVDQLMHMASYAARMGSGSACRSLFGGFTVWGNSSCVTGASDEYAIPVTGLVHPDMLLLKDAILVVSSNPKSLPSTSGHRTMNGHPFFDGRIIQANRNLEEALQALSANDFEKLSLIAEGEALTLHALIMSANPGTLLMKSSTVEIIHRVRDARKSGLPLFFTLDAGANVHVMYPAAAAVVAEKYIADSLQPLCEEGRVIFDECGNGPISLIPQPLLPGEKGSIPSP